MDRHIIGYMRLGYSRIGVIIPVFEMAIKQGLTEEMTRRRRDITGEINSVSRQYVVSWTDFTIDARIELTSSSKENSNVGFIGNLDGMIYTADPIVLLDRILYKGWIYEISKPMVEEIGIDGNFRQRSAGLKKIELEARL